MTPGFYSRYSQRAMLLLGIVLVFAQGASAQGSATSPVIISEFRFSGAGGNNDSFIELRNNTFAAVDVSGWSVRDVAGAPIKTFPAGTILPDRSSYLLTKNSGYTLSAFAAADDTYAQAFQQDSGIALYDAQNNLKEAVGFTDTPAGFKEGAGLPQTGNTATVDYSYVRRILPTGLYQDTDNNAADYVLVCVVCTSINGVPAVLGSPGPESTQSPRRASLKPSLIDPTKSSLASPNAERNQTPVTNGQFGTLSLRRRFTNQTGQLVTQIHFRVIDITTLGNQQAGEADIRYLSSTASPPPSGCNVNCKDIEGTEVTKTPSQANNDLGGGHNSGARVGVINLEEPLAPGNAVDVQFALGVQEKGTFRFFVVMEAKLQPLVPVAPNGGAKAAVTSGKSRRLK